MSLRLVELSHRFGPLKALDRVSLHVRQGDCYGFCGHNGAGKTTALRIALGLLRPDSGKVTLDGLDLASRPRARGLIGGLIEVPGFHPSLSGQKNLQLLAALSGLDSAAARDEVQRALEVMDLSAVARKPVRQYSQGMRQRLGLAQALLGRPRYLLLDEPTSGLDPEGIHELRALLTRLNREEGVTILLSSHRLQEVAELCNRVAVLHQGRLLLEAETRELLQPDKPDYLLQTDDLPGAGTVLEGLSLPHSKEPDGWCLQSLERDPGEVLQSLVQAGVKVRAFAPRPRSLESIYLEYSRSGKQRLEVKEAEAGRTESEPRAAAPILPRLRLPILLVAKYELQRLLRPGPLFALATPLLLLPAAVFYRNQQVLAQHQEVAQGSLASATKVTAFEGVAVGLQAALPLLALVLAGLASQSVAGELSRGTLRNLLLRPYRRGEVALGKALGLISLALLVYLLLAGMSLFAASLSFDFEDLDEILPNGESFPLVPAAELWPELWPSLLAPVLPLLAYAGIGFLCGTLVRGATTALALALGTTIFLDLSRVLARGQDLEGYLPSAYLPSPLGDSSKLQEFLDLSRGISNASFEHGQLAGLVPPAYALACFCLATVLLQRRSVP